MISGFSSITVYEMITGEGSGMLIGYARVSTADQSMALQDDALRVAGCEKLFTDTASGASKTRPGLEAALAYLRPGDTLCVWKLDRLGRSLRHLIEVVNLLSPRNLHRTDREIPIHIPRQRIHCFQGKVVVG